MTDASAPSTAVVDVKSAWASKVNWTQAVGVTATALALFSGNKYQIPPETQVAIIAGIQGIQAAVTWVVKTWFTPTVSAASVAK